MSPFLCIVLHSAIFKLLNRVAIKYPVMNVGDSLINIKSPVTDKMLEIASNNIFWVCLSENVIKIKSDVFYPVFFRLSRVFQFLFCFTSSTLPGVQ